ncbi:MAG TPA: RDD family protein [Nocardioidaceae bacterium]
MAEGGVSPVPREARPYQGRRAGLVTRFVAALVDAAVVGLILLGGYLGLTVVLFMVDPRGFAFPEPRLIVSLSAAFGVAVVYLTLSWWVSGRTYGCLVMGLRVVNFRGDAMRLSGALVRALLCVGFPIGLVWVALSPENRSLADLLLRSSVVYDWQPRATSVVNRRP